MALDFVCGHALLLSSSVRMTLTGMPCPARTRSTSLKKSSIRVGLFCEVRDQVVAPSKERPHGLRYSLTLHGPGGKRLVGFDNAHGVAAVGPVMASVSLSRTTGTERKPTPADRIGSGTPPGVDRNLRRTQHCHQTGAQALRSTAFMRLPDHQALRICGRAEAHEQKH
jgi:hypothetical protein